MTFFQAQFFKHISNQWHKSIKVLTCNSQSTSETWVHDNPTTVKIIPTISVCSLDTYVSVWFKSTF